MRETVAQMKVGEEQAFPGWRAGRVVFVGCSLLVQFLLLSTPARAFQQYMEIHYCPTVGSNRLLLIRQL